MDKKLGRPKGVKDSKPRKQSETAIANLRPNRTIPGFKSVNGRIYAPASTARWYGGMTPLERGEFVERAKLAENTGT